MGQARCRRQPARDALGRGGPLGLDRRERAHPDQAFQLLAWLSGKEWGTRVASASPATTLYRRSQVRDPRPWVDPLTDSQATAEFATAVRDALSEQASLAVPRIPGQNRYMAALDEAVAAALAGSTTPEAALQEAAARWQSITAELGLDAQRKAYRNSLGLEPYAGTSGVQEDQSQRLMAVQSFILGGVGVRSRGHQPEAQARAIWDLVPFLPSLGFGLVLPSLNQ